eukprot:3004748-Rhodomonas_salina.2
MHSAPKTPPRNQTQEAAFLVQTALKLRSLVLDFGVYKRVTSVVRCHQVFSTVTVQLETLLDRARYWELPRCLLCDSVCGTERAVIARVMRGIVLAHRDVVPCSQGPPARHQHKTHSASDPLGSRHRRACATAETLARGTKFRADP